QVVEDFPAGNRRGWIAHIVPGLVWHAREEPLYDLPITPNPAMVAAPVRRVMRRIVLDDFDIGRQSRAGISAFDQVVAEQRIAWKAPVEHRIKRCDLIDAFAGKDTFAVKILIGVGNCARVDIETGLPGVDGSQS